LEEDEIVVGASYTHKGEEKRSYAPLTCICAGVSSIFRSELNESEPVVASNFIALILKDVNDKILFPDHGNVLLEERPILMYPISSNEVRVLIDHKGDVPSQTNGELQKFLLEDVIRLIPEALHDAYKLAVATSVKYMPNRTLNADPKQKLGVFLLGDSLNCRHPLTGGGQSVIFSDIVILRELLQDIDFKEYGQLQDAFEVFHSKRKSVAATINILANALYYIFSATEGNMEDMKKAVLQYFHLGGVCVSGPMGFLSGLDPRPYYLLTHFFAVALYGSLQIVWNSPLSILLAGSLVYKAAKLVVPIIRNEKILGKI
jgi:squalene monooxygenase